MKYIDYIHANRAAWNAWTEDHLRDENNGVEALRHGETTLSPIERVEVGPVEGRSLLHLMCHLGVDTLSWAREGAQVTGVDFSKRSIEAAKGFAHELEISARFILSEFYESVDVVADQFDIVFMSGGVLCWLPDIRRWADVIAYFTKPGGVFYIREGHPMFMTLAQDRDDNLMVIQDNYFETEEPLRDDESVVGKSRSLTSYGWSHGLGEIVNALINVGFRIDFLNEHKTGEDWSWLLPMRQRSDGQWELIEGRDRLPLQFSIRAVKDH